MQQLQLKLKRHVGPLCVLAVLSSLWLWLLAASVFDIGIQGFGRSITMALVSLYFLLVPLGCLATIVLAVVGGVRKRLPWPIVVGHLLVVAFALGVWWWSLTLMEV